MQKYRFSNPQSVVEVTKSAIDDNDPRNKYSIWDCLCRPFGHKKEPRRRYQITAASAPQAAQMAMTNYRNDYPNGKEK